MKRTWNSPRGQRSVDHVDAEGRVFVRTEGSPHLHILREADIAREVQIDEQGVARRERFMQDKAVEEEMEVKAHASKTGLHGFTSKMPRVKAAKIADVLDKVQGFGGEFTNRRMYVEGVIANGGRVIRAHGERRLEKPSGAYNTEKDITKVAMDYAEYLGKLEDEE